MCDYGVFGLQLGIGTAIAAQSISYFAMLALTNWQDVADQAAERIKKEN